MNTKSIVQEYIERRDKVSRDYIRRVYHISDDEVVGVSFLPTPIPRCAYCNTVFVEDSRGHCASCGAPQ